MIKLFDSKLSGNSWKVRLLLRYLQIPFERETLDLRSNIHKSKEFTQRNRFQRIPVIQLADGRHIAESGAILIFFSDGTALLPRDPVKRTDIMAWLFYEQSDLLRFLAYPRYYAITGQTDAYAGIISHYRELGEVSLGRVESALSEQEWIAGNQLSVGDFAIYPYVRLASEGGYDLSKRTSITSWMNRFEALPAHEPLVPTSGS